MFVSAPELLAAAKAGKLYGARIPDLTAAEAHLDGVLQEALNNQQGFKGYNKPFQLVDFNKILDPKQAWIGFEFETGFDDKKDYQKVIHHLWAQPYTSLDKEGTGKFPIEIVYAPMNLSDVLDGNSTLQKTVEFYRDSKITPALNPTTASRRDVGIHAGISTAKSRKLREQYEIGGRLSRILSDLTKTQMDELYGRHTLHWGTANARQKYIELKMFRAIPEVDQIKVYIGVVAQCTKLLDFLIDNPNVNALSNTYAFLSGKDAEPKAA